MIRSILAGLILVDRITLKRVTPTCCKKNWVISHFWENSWFATLRNPPFCCLSGWFVEFPGDIFNLKKISIQKIPKETKVYTLDTSTLQQPSNLHQPFVAFLKFQLISRVALVVMKILVVTSIRQDSPISWVALSLWLECLRILGTSNNTRR